MSSTCTGSAFLTAQLGALGFSTVLLLSGCSAFGADPGTQGAEESTTSAKSSGSTGPAGPGTSTPTPPPTAPAYRPATAEGPAENVPLPVMPEVAKEESAEGLRAFGEYWFSLVNYGFETGDAAPVRELSAPECERCDIFYADLEEGYVDDDWIHGGEININSAGTQFVKTPEGRYQLLLSIRQDEVANRGPDGKIYFEAPIDDQNTAQIMEATYSSGRWVVNLVENM